MARTITASYLTRVTLTNTGDNPVTVAAGVTLLNGLYGDPSGAWTITNYGLIQNTVEGTFGTFEPISALFMASASTITNDATISATGTYGVGVDLSVGGSIFNAGAITSTGFHGYGVYLQDGGYLSNSGTISASGTYGYAVYMNYTTQPGTVTNAAGAMIYGTGGAVEGFEGTVTNAGTMSASGTASFVVDVDGGAVTNQLGGTITGSADAVVGAATVVNSGSIISGSGGFGVNLNGATVVNNQSGYIAGKVGVYLIGGTLTNAGTINGTVLAVRFVAGNTGRLIVDPGAVFTGTVQGGNPIGGTSISTMELASGSGTGTVTAFGSNYVNFAQVTVDANASWRFDYSDALGSGVTLTNAGTISGILRAHSGAYISNMSGGMINGDLIGIYQTPNPAGIVTVANSGTLHGSGYGVEAANAIVTNAAGAVISGGKVGILTSVGSVDNSGRIAGTSASSGYLSGVALQNGTIVNHATGTIVGSRYGVLVGYAGGGGVGTVVNAGTIRAVGYAGVTSAVLAGISADSEVKVYPGARFIGAVDGAPSLSSVYTNQLELAPGTSVGSIGTLHSLGGQYLNFNRVTIDAGATWSFAGTNTLVSGATLTDSGDLRAGTLLNNGVILIDPAHMRAALTGTGSVTIGSNSTLEVYGTVAAGQTIVMTGTNDFLEIDAGTDFHGTITGFAGGNSGDVIDVQGIGLAQSAVIGINPHQYALYLHDSGGGGGSVIFSFPSIQTILGAEGGVATGLQFNPDDNGGTLIACYLRGTRIRTPRGELPIEFLAVGDWVETLTGPRPIRWIGRRRYVLAQTEGHDTVLPVLVRAGAIADGIPLRDLHVSPEHALFIDGVLAPARHLTNGKSIVQRLTPHPDPLPQGEREIEYFHLELAEHAVLFAEGMPAETFVDCDSRGMFDNAHTYTGGGAKPWTFCAPRVEEGEALEDIRLRLSARAGIACDAGVGPLIGKLERIAGCAVEGWAQDSAAPERPVWLEILDAGEVVARVLANRHRNDLLAAGLGSGRHAFRVALARQPRSVEARRVEDGALVPASNAARLPVSR